MGQLGVGQAVQRVDDLVTGAGRYADDIGWPRTACAFVQRDGIGHVDMPATPEKFRRPLDAAL